MLQILVVFILPEIRLKTFIYDVSTTTVKCRCFHYTGYGLTETGGSGTLMPMEGPDKPGSCGYVIPETQVKVNIISPLLFITFTYPADTKRWIDDVLTLVQHRVQKHWINVVLMFVQRCQRGTNVKSTSIQRLVSAVYCIYRIRSIAIPI